MIKHKLLLALIICLDVVMASILKNKNISMNFHISPNLTISNMTIDMNFETAQNDSLFTFDNSSLKQSLQIINTTFINFKGTNLIKLSKNQ